MRQRGLLFDKTASSSHAAARTAVNLITDADLDALVALPFISSLSLDETSITDASVATLGKISGLTRLSLRSTAVTDEAIPFFEAMTALQWLDLRGTKVTKNGIARLSQTKASCALGHD